MSLIGNEQIRAFLDKLTATTNVSKYVELPTIAVMGETSSGKSSLLSSLTGVELPSAAELTTRCPIRLHMSRAASLRAVVDVQWKDTPNGKQKEDIQFETVTVKEDQWAKLPESIAQAQKHIIGISGKLVARDIVQVKVEGPHCEDLTVVDLPGIVRTHGVNEDKSIILDIQALIDEYLNNSRCVILAVVPANVDFHNSQIMSDAFKVDPETKRTIPVITKPDLIDEGAEQDVLDLLLGRKTHKFQMGFHMVKGRGQKDLDNNMTIEAGLNQEASYFRTKQPWCSVNEPQLFGIEHLRKKLGQLQLDMMQETLPDIISEIQERHKTAFNELKSIGDIPNSASEKKMYYREISEEVTRLISGMLGGSSTGVIKCTDVKKQKLTLPSMLHEECNKFQRTLKKSKFSNIGSVQVGKPVLVSLRCGKVIRGKVVGVTDDAYYIDYEDRASVHRTEFIVKYKAPTTDEHREKTAGSTWSDSDGNVCIANGDASHDELEPVPAEKVRTDPSWILVWIKTNRTTDLPIFASSRVFQAIVVHFITDEWIEPAKKLVQYSLQLLLEAIEQSLRATAKLDQFPKLRYMLQRKIKAIAATVTDKTRTFVEHFIKKECTPYTQDHYLFENVAKERFAPLLQLLTVALDLRPDNGDDKIRKKSVESIIRAVINLNQAKSVDDHMAEDMQIALNAYGKVVLKRFIDEIPMECFKMLRDFPVEVKTILDKTSDDDIDRYLVVCADAERQRDTLAETVRDLEAGLDVLKSLW